VPADVADPYLPLKDLARYAGLGVRTLRRYLADPAGPLPHYRLGGKVLVRRSEYDAWALRFRRDAAPSLGSLVDDVMRDFVP
jgi:excisionase family DNA binding protein